MAGGARVPQPQLRDAVGVDVFGSALQLGEYRQVVTGVVGERVSDLEQNRSVTLNDQRSVGNFGRIHLDSLDRAADRGDAAEGKRAFDVCLAVAAAKPPAAEASGLQDEDDG